jgi:plasmid stabilization system protein ParE
VFPIFFGPAARAEIIEAANWYAANAPVLAARFTGEVDAVVERIADNPLQFPVALKDVRRAKLRRFPYTLFFRVVDETVFVVACFHASRDPQRWQGRT